MNVPVVVVASQLKSELGYESKCVIEVTYVPFSSLLKTALTFVFPKSYMRLENLVEPLDNTIAEIEGEREEVGNTLLQVTQEIEA